MSATLGSGFDEQTIDAMAGRWKKTFMLHYNFPPYSVGETRRIGGPSRRDIGHGSLATSHRLRRGTSLATGAAADGTICKCPKKDKWSTSGLRCEKKRSTRGLR